MSSILPKGLFKNSEEANSSIERFNQEPLDLADIAKFWKVYTTTKRRLLDPTAERLENHWWRIWGSRKKKLNGTTVARLFAHISDGQTFVPLRGPPNRDEGTPLSNTTANRGPGASSTTALHQSRPSITSSSAALRNPAPMLRSILKKTRGPSTSGPRLTARFISPPESEGEADLSSSASNDPHVVVEPPSSDSQNTKFDRKASPSLGKKKGGVVASRKKRSVIVMRQSSQTSQSSSKAVPSIVIVPSSSEKTLPTFSEQSHNPPQSSFQENFSPSPAEEERKKKADKEAAKEAKKKAKEETKREKKERKVYGSGASSASGSALSLSLPGLGRRRGNSGASNLGREITREDVEGSTGKGKGIDRGVTSAPSDSLGPSAPIDFTRSGRHTGIPGARHFDMNTLANFHDLHLPSPSPTAPEKPSHLRQMSNASSPDRSKSPKKPNTLQTSDWKHNPPRKPNTASLDESTERADSSGDPGPSTQLRRIENLQNGVVRSEDLTAEELEEIEVQRTLLKEANSRVKKESRTANPLVATSEGFLIRHRSLRPQSDVKVQQKGWDAVQILVHETKGATSLAPTLTAATSKVNLGGVGAAPTGTSSSGDKGKGDPEDASKAGMFAKRPIQPVQASAVSQLTLLLERDRARKAERKSDDEKGNRGKY